MHTLPSLQECDTGRFGRRSDAGADDVSGRTARRSGRQTWETICWSGGRRACKGTRRRKIDRKLVFVTNAVKHFKFEPRGKRRLHKRPNAYEIGRCHWWLDYERSIVRPGIIVALGATAIRSVSGRPITINRIRGRVISLPDGGHMLATIHPSYILRIEDDAAKRDQYRKFVADLKLCRKFLVKAAELDGQQFL